MSNAIAAAALPADSSKRRLVGGLLVSVLLHALISSLQFGIPGLHPGQGGSLAVRLAPMPKPAVANPAPAVASADPVPAPALAPLGTPPIAPPAPAMAPLPAPRTHAGFTLLDPAQPEPAPVPAPVAIAPHRTPRRRSRVRAPAARDGLHTDVIAQDQHKDDSFSVPPLAGEPAPDPEPVAKTETPAPSETMADGAPAQATQSEPAQAEADEQAQQAERARLAEQREQERDHAREQALQARRDADEQALRTAADAEARRAAEQQARVLAEQDARYQDDLMRRQRQAEDDRRQATQAAQAAEAAQQLAEQQRVQAEQARTQQLAEQQRVQAEQARAQQLAEQRRVQAEQTRAQQLAEQRATDERQRELQARQQVEQMAREQAQQAARLAQQEQARRQQDRGDDPGGSTRAGPAGAIAGEGGGRGVALPGAVQGGSMVSRARDLMRGIDIDKPVPQVMRPAEQARRAMADAVLRDVPLRMYIDSVRQKIERNAVVGAGLLAEDVVRVFPVVSIAIRSDGSIEDVTVVRSSGRADVDEIVRRIVRLNARYAAFPPNVAANYDVVELRRVWSFSGVLRLLEEIR